MSRNHELASFTVATTLMSISAFDQALHYQLEAKDDATLALWTGVGLETMTLVAVLLASPAQAFDGEAIPGREDLTSLEARTARFPRLVAAAESLYPEAAYPTAGREFMRKVRNKLLHVGGTRHVGLVAPSLDLIVDVGRWLQGVELPTAPLRHQPRVLDAKKIEDVPTALQAGAVAVAVDNAEHLRWSLDDGLWDDTPELKAIAQRELADCERISRL